MSASARSALAAIAAIVVLLLLFSLLGSDPGGDQRGGDQRPGAFSPPHWQPPPRCAATLPNGSNPPGESSPEHHGNGKLWTVLGRRGVFVVGPEAAPEYYGPGGEIAVDGVVGPDGSVSIKAPWWRGPGVRGQVRLRARRLDAPAPRVDRTVSSSGYGLTGFQATGLALPTTGCWKVSGSVAHATLTFVTLVWRARPAVGRSGWDLLTALSRSSGR